MARIQVPLSDAEWKQLLIVADQECREPRQQARFMLKRLLQQKSEGTRESLATNRVPSEPIHPTQLEGQNPTQLGERKASSL